MNATIIKLLVGSAVALAIVAGAYFAIQSYRATVADNVKLRSAVAAQAATITQMEKDQLRINNAVDTNAKETTRIVERNNTIKEAVNAQPTTTSCSSSPAISVALRGLREDATGPHGTDAAKLPAQPVPVP